MDELAGRPRLLRSACRFLALAILISSANRLLGGGGPENVFLVVNARSWSSRTVANHYQSLRRIPASNVFYLDWPHSVYTTTLADFRQSILAPTFEAIDQRKLSAQIDYIVYSSDFPYAIDFSEVSAKEDKFPVASLTGLTYLATLSSTRANDFRAANSNWYAAIGRDGKLLRPARAFRSQYGWNRNSSLAASQGQSYVLSCMLGYSSGRGNSVDDIVRALQSAAAADGSRPRGTVYFADSGDPLRSGTRKPNFTAAIDELSKHNVRGEIVSGPTPVGKPDIMGAMLGVAAFQWDDAGCKLLPGAIAENFTSYGAIFQPDTSQTPISEFVRRGVAGTSGTVVEPYALAEKFPDPMLHAFYCAGCSLAEAFYQSVRAPYQLLILGDPLCQPWSVPPKFSVEGLESGQTISGTIEVKPHFEPGTSEEAPIHHYQLFVDGRLFATAIVGEGFRLATEKIPDGYHELRVVGTVDSLIETQGRVTLPFYVDNLGRRPTWKLRGNSHQVPLGTAAQFDLSAPMAERIVVLDKRRTVAQCQGEQGTVSIATDHLGLGPVELTVVAIYPASDEGTPSTNHAAADPIKLEILPPSQVAGQPTAPPNLKEGLQVIFDGGTARQVTSTTSPNWLSSFGGGPGKPFRFNGRYFCQMAGVHQFQVEYQGSLKVSLNGRVIYENTNKELQREFIPLNLGHGWHTLEISGTLDNTDQFLVDFGLIGTRPLDKVLFKH